MMKLTEAEAEFLGLHYWEVSDNRHDGPAHQWRNANKIMPNELDAWMALLVEERGGVHPPGSEKPFVPPWNNAVEFRQRSRILFGRAESFLTSKEAIYLDYLAKESLNHEKGPAIEWLQANNLTQSEILNLVAVRERERDFDIVLEDIPHTSFEIAWANGEEVKARNAELALVAAAMYRRTGKS